jgi:broad specificity phosphatase PhoE
MMADLWLVRHGQAGEMMGEYDLLSERGWEQARVAGAGWRHIAPVSHTIHGAMRRHRETAQGFAEGFGGLPDPVEDAAWNEFDHQAVIRSALGSGMQPDPSQGRAGFFRFFLDAMGRWADGDHDADYPEPYADFQARVVAGLERATARLGKGETGVVFTSGGAISAVCRHLLDLTPQKAFTLNLSLVNTGVTRLRVAPGWTTLASLNVHAHLDSRPELLTHS